MSALFFLVILVVVVVVSPLTQSRESGDGYGGYGSFDKLRSSVIRINTVELDFDWERPYIEGAAQAAVGSGWMVDMSSLTSEIKFNESKYKNDPVFITNAHVVLNSIDITISVPALGDKTFQAFVPLIWHEYDLAIVRLLDPDDFFKITKAANVEMLPIALEQDLVALGTKVVAVGFPLGSDTLKISTGIISGTQIVKNEVSFQSTAPISPGNSGGPLLNASSMKMIGVNYAVPGTHSAHSIAYVVPGVKCMQILNAFLEDDRENSTGSATTVSTVGPLALIGDTETLKRVRHRHLMQASLKSMTTLPSPDLYKYKGCSSGVLLTGLGMPFKNGMPMVKPESFLTSINGHKINEYGKGRNGYFLNDDMPFTQLADVICPAPICNLTVETCTAGKVQNHTVNLSWGPQYFRFVANVKEPIFEPWYQDYEVFAGITFMNLAKQHAKHVAPDAMRPDGRPYVVITHIKSGSYASQVLDPGMVVEEVNGVKVGTLPKLRKVLLPNMTKTPYFTLQSDSGNFFTVNFTKAAMEQLRRAKFKPYLRTPGLKMALEKMMAAKMSPPEKVSPCEAARRANRSNSTGPLQKPPPHAKPGAERMPGENLNASNSSGGDGDGDGDHGDEEDVPDSEETSEENVSAVETHHQKRRSAKASKMKHHVSDSAAGASTRHQHHRRKEHQETNGGAEALMDSAVDQWIKEEAERRTQRRLLRKERNHPYPKEEELRLRKERDHRQWQKEQNEVTF
jgi:S1-C subfamily serine protease